MSSEESAQEVRGEPETRWSRPAGESDLRLPSSLDSWVAALGLWTSVDSPTYRLVARCFGNGGGPEWAFVCSQLSQSGLVEPVSGSGAYTFRPEWVPALERALADLGGADAARARLVDAWLKTPELKLVAEVAGWASAASHWDAVDEIWMALLEHTGAFRRKPCQSFATCRQKHGEPGRCSLGPRARPRRC